jgi:hypothetical protein
MRIIKVNDPRKIFRRIHDGFIMGREIVLGQDFSTGKQREDLPEYYEEVTPENAPMYPYPSGKKILIPAEWETFFPDDLFIIENFVVILERVNQNLVIDTSYLSWQKFLKVLETNSDMREVWNYIKQQYENKNFII